MDSLQSAASGLNLQIEGINPKTKEEVREHILAKIREDRFFDYVLIDFDFHGKRFDGLDILRLLRPPADLESLDERYKLMHDPNMLRLFYLPAAIVTRGGSVIENQPYFNDEALGAGADKVYTEKGFGIEPDSEDTEVQFQQHYTARACWNHCEKMDSRKCVFVPGHGYGSGAVETRETRTSAAMRQPTCSVARRKHRFSLRFNRLIPAFGSTLRVFK
ncbi:MAG: hypothetical protein ACRESZ_04215 [Methylococcales bacterium]